MFSHLRLLGVGRVARDAPVDLDGGAHGCNHLIVLSQGEALRRCQRAAQRSRHDGEASAMCSILYLRGEDRPGGDHEYFGRGDLVKANLSGWLRRELLEHVGKLIVSSVLRQARTELVTYRIVSPRVGLAVEDDSCLRVPPNECGKQPMR